MSVRIAIGRRDRPMIFVFEVRVRPGHDAEEYAEAWIEASRIIQSHAGAQGTRLHRMIGRSDRLLAIARWESKAARDDAEGRRDPRVQAILDERARYVDVEIIGEFNEPEWVVWPPGDESPERSE
ncbi:MAG: antibiotic biosynthesis monooxygenase family protein [bacterium]